MLSPIKTTLVAATFLALAPLSAAANVSEEGLIRQIESEGYQVIYTETTWLGRRRVLSVSGDHLREVVIGPGTGEIMRDVVYNVPGLAEAIRKAKPRGGRKVIDLSELGGPETADVTAVDPPTGNGHVDVGNPPADGTTQGEDSHAEQHDTDLGPDPKGVGAAPKE